MSWKHLCELSTERWDFCFFLNKFQLLKKWKRKLCINQLCLATWLQEKLGCWNLPFPVTPSQLGGQSILPPGMSPWAPAVSGSAFHFWIWTVFAQRLLGALGQRTRRHGCRTRDTRAPWHSRSYLEVACSNISILPYVRIKQSLHWLYYQPMFTLKRVTSIYIHLLVHTHSVRECSLNSQRPPLITLITHRVLFPLHMTIWNVFLE